MDTKPAAGRRVYEDFIPSHELAIEDGAAILTVELPGYRKEQLRVQIDNYGKLTMSGERPLGDNRWSRFRKEFHVPENCNVSDIRAKFENGFLYVILPKLIPEVREQEQPAEAPQKPKEDQKPTREPKPGALQDDMKQKAPVEPNGVTKKQEGEKRGEPTDARKDEKKVEEKEKDEAKEKKYKEKAGDVVKPEEGKKDDAVTDVQKKEAVTEPAAAGRGRNGVRKWADELGLRFYEPRQFMVNAIVAVGVLFAVGWYVTYKLSRPKEEDGY